MSNPVSFIRRSVLGMTQAQLAEALTTTQATISRWERVGRFPDEHQATIREMGRAMRDDWSDSWFFDVPEVAA